MSPLAPHLLSSHHGEDTHTFIPILSLQGQTSRHTASSPILHLYSCMTDQLQGHTANMMGKVKACDLWAKRMHKTLKRALPVF